MTQESPAMAGASAAPVEGEASQKTSVFIPKDALGGRECKPGEKLTFTVKDVDQETGDVEVMAEGYDDEKSESDSYGTSEAIDAMPEDE